MDTCHPGHLPTSGDFARTYFCQGLPMRRAALSQGERTSPPGEALGDCGGPSAQNDPHPHKVFEQVFVRIPIKTKRS